MRAKFASERDGPLAKAGLVRGAVESNSVPADRRRRCVPSSIAEPPDRLVVRREDVDLDRQATPWNRKIEAGRSVAGNIDLVLPHETSDARRDEYLAHDDFCMRFGGSTSDTTIELQHERPHPAALRRQPVDCHGAEIFVSEPSIEHCLFDHRQQVVGPEHA